MMIVENVGSLIVFAQRPQLGMRRSALGDDEMLTAMSAVEQIWQR